MSETRSEDRRPLSSASGRIRPMVLLTLVWLLAGGVISSCSRQNEDIPDRMRAYLDAARRFWNFQGAVLTAKDGRVVYKAGFGLADLEEEIPVTPATKFLVASITKTFTAAAALILEEEGLLKLGSPIGEYLGDFPPGTAGKVTVRHLLSHASGLPEAAAGLGSPGEFTKPRMPAELMALFKDKPLEFEPGTRSRYSNSGYVVLGQVIERVSSRSYYDFVRERIFQPLGMKDSGVRHEGRSVPEMAVGYMEGKDGRLIKAPIVHPSLGYSAGAFYSTVEDLFKWDRGLDSTKILPRTSLERMFTRFRDGFGYGWLIMEAWGRKSAAHGGGAPGFSSWIERWPDEKVFVAVLSNNGRTPAGEIGRSLAAILFGRDYTLPRSCEAIRLEPEVLEEYVGTYRIDDRNSRRVIRKGESLFVERSGGRLYPILPYAEDRFFFPHDRGASIRFVRDDKDQITGHVFHQLGADETADRLTAEPGRPDFSSSLEPLL